MEPPVGDSSTADAVTSSVAASVADEEGERPVEPQSGDPSTADDATSEEIPRSAESKGRHDV